MFNRTAGLIVFLFAVSLPLFYHLDQWPFRLWDESRLATNAYEMHRNGNLIVTHYDGKPEMWNTKPPLMIWLQTASIKLFGFNELAVRLPSALAGLMTCLALLFLSRRIWGSYLAGAFGSLVLVTTNGYVDAHAVRTGDYDALLALFSTLFALAAYMFSESGNRKWMNLFFMAIVLAVLTKSVQALLFLPGMALYFLIKRKDLSMKIGWRKASRHFVFGAALSILIVGSYYLSREFLNDGYLETVWENELGGRYFEGLEENAAGPDYYLSWMYNHIFIYWLWFLPVALLGGFLSKDPRVKNFTLYNLLVTVFYFIFISTAKTKLYWYVVPLLPLLALQIGISVKQVYDFIRKRLNATTFKDIIALAMVALVFIYPYYGIANKVTHPAEYEWDENTYPISYLLQDALHGRRSLHHYVIVYSTYDQHLRLYAKALKDKGQALFFKSVDNLKPGDHVIAGEEHIMTEIEKGFDFELIEEDKGYRIYVLK